MATQFERGIIRRGCDDAMEEAVENIEEEE